MALVTLVGCTINRLPMTLSGSSPVRLNVSRTSTSYRAKVRRYGRRTSSKRASRICWTRKTEVAARIADAGPNRCSQVSPARSIGSNGSPSARTMNKTLPGPPRLPPGRRAPWQAIPPRGPGGPGTAPHGRGKPGSAAPGGLDDAVALQAAAQDVEVAGQLRFLQHCRPSLGPVGEIDLVAEGVGIRRRARRSPPGKFADGSLETRGVIAGQLVGVQLRGESHVACDAADAADPDAHGSEWHLHRVPGCPDPVGLGARLPVARLCDHQGQPGEVLERRGRAQPVVPQGAVPD